MKLEKEALKSKINELVTDNEVAIQILEDIEDSMEIPVEPDTKEIDELKAKYEDLQEKYKSRFVEGNTKEDKKENTEELKEEKIIDIKEI